MVLVAQALPEIAMLDSQACRLGTVEVPATAPSPSSARGAWWS